jgi:hypothetical protein
MIEDMTLRGFQDKTQRGYIRIVSAFAEFLGRSSPVNNPHPIAIEWVFGGLKYSDLQDFAVFGRFSCDLGARLREGGSAWAAVLIQCAGLFHGADNAPQATCP